jgi:hypothetical protein
MVGLYLLMMMMIINVHYRGGRCGEWRGGGFLLDPGGNKVMDYYWNLGIETNNRVESYVLFYGILLVKHKKINTLNVVGDSKMIIILMISGSSPKDLSLNKIMDRIWLHSSGILMCFLHAYRHNNFEVDELANQEIGKSLGILGVNLEESYAPFP